MLKKRIHFVELQDLAWMPNSIREGVTDYLSFVLKIMKYYHPVLPILQSLLQKTKSHTIVDLCSGAGGALPSLKSQLPSDCKIILTDLYPNLKSFQHQKNLHGFEFDSRSNDARNLPEDLKGLRTLFTSFHHFTDDDAHLILGNAYKSNQPIMIAEFTKRSLLNLLMVIPSGILMLLFVPFLRPFKISRLVLTYIIPLIPFVTTWDIIVTVLRSRKPEELLELTNEIREGYTWSADELPSTLLFSTTYLIGYPEIAPNSERG